MRHGLRGGAVLRKYSVRFVNRVDPTRQLSSAKIKSDHFEPILTLQPFVTGTHGEGRPISPSRQSDDPSESNAA
jgi:hypothetical protein